MLTLGLVEVRVDTVQDLPQVDLSGIVEHHHGAWGIDLVGEAECKNSLGQ